MGTYTYNMYLPTMLKKKIFHFQIVLAELPICMLIGERAKYTLNLMLFQRHVQTCFHGSRSEINVIPPVLYFQLKFKKKTKIAVVS